MVHFPPSKLKSPLYNYSITCLRAILLVSGLSASSATRGLNPDHLDFSYLRKVGISNSLTKSIMVLLMNSLSYCEQTGLLVGSVNFFYVVPAKTLPSQGCTKITLPSVVGAVMPKLPLVSLASQTIWLPPTAQILLLTLGLSNSLILSAQTPVQLTTYFAWILYVFPVRLSLKTPPMIFPQLFLMKSTNSALLSTFAGMKLSGILRPFPSVAVKSAARSSLESLKDPSSYTTPMEYLGLIWGKASTSSCLLRKQGGRKVVLVFGEYHLYIQQYISEPTQQQRPQNILVQGITQGNLLVRWEALSIIEFLSSIDSLTRWNFSILEEIEAKENSKTCCRYLTPPCTSLVDFELAPEEKSSFSMRRVLRPRVEASKSTPTPLHPPPINSTSQLGFFSIQVRWSALVLNLGILASLEVGVWQLVQEQARENEAKEIATFLVICILNYDANVNIKQDTRVQWKNDH